MTNYERIVNMSKEELAEELRLVANWDRREKNKAEKYCDNFYLEWLNAECKF